MDTSPEPELPAPVPESDHPVTPDLPPAGPQAPDLPPAGAPEKKQEKEPEKQSEDEPEKEPEKEPDKDGAARDPDADRAAPVEPAPVEPPD
ncbi:hypothetical protein ABZZ17_12705 [Streptomyces sp. NPDC006512]|uniref:hypothetical protein n=1 Tax=Streptomyces sp. NPDC006512 TaxID=3154307 RepID=UPI0033B1C97E